MITFVISFILWATVHSVTAASSPKTFIRQQMGERAFAGLYRLLYNLFSLATFVPVLYLLATQVSARPIWVIPKPYSLGAYLIQLVGLIGLLVAFWQTDVWDFMGLRQAARYLNGAAELTAPPTLVTNGMYALVRHPLYFFSLLIIWFSPVMSLNGLIFNAVATLYLWIGSIYEERRLAAVFGDVYRDYQQKAPRLFPLRLPFI